jgi:hypothetical protein
MWEYLVGHIMDVDLHIAVRQGSSNKSPGWDFISLELNETYWEVIKDDLLPL